MTTLKVKTPTFYFDKEKQEKPIRAGGVILYRFNKTTIDLLIAENRGFYEDLGGCTDEGDKDIYHTVAREAYEESNKLIKRKRLIKRLKESYPIYNARSKYVIFVVKATDKEAKLKSSDFGDMEIHDGIKRKIKWIKLDEFMMKDVISIKLNFRMKHRDLFTKLNSIKIDKQLSKSMFSKSSKSPNSDDEMPKKKTK